MALVNLQDVSLAFGGPRRLDQVNWQIERGERIFRASIETSNPVGWC